VDDLRISPRQAAEKIDAGTAFLLDVVTEGSWHSLRQVPKGALRIPPEEINARWGEIPRGRAAIAFCT
jgi:rhodanese-related sulfurtransferase